jgi:hypothetical protein
MAKRVGVEKEILVKELKEGRSVIDRYCVTFDHGDRVIVER